MIIVPTIFLVVFTIFVDGGDDNDDDVDDDGTNCGERFVDDNN